jgi:hypothetical protein
MRASIVAALIVAGAMAFAATIQAGQGGQAPKEHTMTGCLQKGATASTGVVQNTAEKGPKTIGIIESKANLAPHVGHKIDITGTAVPTKDAEGGAVKADHYMRITAIKMVSATCP